MDVVGLRFQLLLAPVAAGHNGNSIAIVRLLAPVALVVLVVRLQ